MTHRADGPSRSRLDADDWIDAALALTAEEGLAAVGVEPLARRVGATKGSFYWHFANREALLVAVLDRWQVIATRAVIDQLETIADPLDKLRRLAEVTNRSTWEDRLEHAMTSAVDDPLVGPVVRRVLAEREAYVAGIFRALGFSRSTADLRAGIVMHAFVGRLRLQSGRRPSASAAATYNRELVALLTAGRT